ncbi:MAG TPA: histidine kinase, partial [Chitinophagaceae bacterium]|nr:histidine kinase [Chitinophagaceae bacterium]
MDTKEQEYYNSLVIVLIVVGIVLVYFIITAIRYQRRSLRLHKERIKAEIDTLENERKRIAADLHDELGPLLSAVKLQINNLDTTGTEDLQAIDKSSRYIDTIITKLREISNDLMPNTLLRKGLKNAIVEFIDNSQDAYKLPVKFICEQDLQLSQEKEINLYRIVQEITHNTLKHAKASMFIIKISIQDDRLFLLTADNGIGFDYFSK